MELDTITPEMPALLIELGINYDPERLSDALATSWPQVGAEQHFLLNFVYSYTLRGKKVQSSLIIW
jgi:hypothetical protein